MTPCTQLFCLMMGIGGVCIYFWVNNLIKYSDLKKALKDVETQVENARFKADVNQGDIHSLQEIARELLEKFKKKNPPKKGKDA